MSIKTELLYMYKPKSPKNPKSNTNLNSRAIWRWWKKASGHTFVKQKDAFFFYLSNCIRNIFFFQWTWFFLWLFHSGIFFFFSFTWVDWLFSQVHLRYTYPSSKQMGPSLDKSNWSLGLKKELPFFTLQNNKFVNFARPLISNTTWSNRLGTLLFCIYSLLI